MKLFILGLLVAGGLQGMQPLYTSSVDDETKHDLIEGYWASCSDPKKDWYQGKYPFPHAESKPWPGQEQFLQKLAQIQSKAVIDQKSPEVKIVEYGGRAHSRLEPGVLLGNAEYVYGIVGKGSICWTDAFGSYYVSKFNVKPSQKFYEFVMNFTFKKNSSCVDFLNQCINEYKNRETVDQ